MVAYHPENDKFNTIIEEWLDTVEKEYLAECEIINAITHVSEQNEHFMPLLLQTIKLIKESKHEFFFYFTEETWPFPKNNSKFNYTIKDWGDPEESELIKEIVQLDYPNVYWFWGVSMMRFFSEHLDNASPKKLKYYKHEDHYQFSKYMRRTITDHKPI